MPVFLPRRVALRETLRAGLLPGNAATNFRRASGLALALLGVWIGVPSGVRAESSLAFQPAGELEAVRATTFDTRGKAVGESSFEIETDDEGNQLMRVTLAIEGGGTNISQATLAAIPEPASSLSGTLEDTGIESPETEGAARPSLHLLEERSQSTTAAGDVYPLLVIDHKRGRVSCYPDGQDPSEGQHVEIEGEDRVVNVPMQLLFLPLVRGEIDSLSFQLATCAKGPVIHQMIAVRGPKKTRSGREVVEIKYGPDLGKTVAFFASRLLPSFSFWFDAETGQYIGHRMPLHRKGPEILLVRHGFTPPDVGVD